MLSQGTTARREALVPEACTQSSGNAVNINNTKTIGKHREVAKKPLYMRISEGLTHVTAWYHGTPRPKFTKFGE